MTRPTAASTVASAAAAPHDDVSGHAFVEPATQPPLARPAPTATPIHPLLASRWSPRAFDRHRTIGEAQMMRLLEAATWAPSCANGQPWRFVAGWRGDDAEAQARWQGIFDGLEPGNQRWCDAAAALVVMAASPTFANGKPNAWSWHDVGAAGMAMALQAHADGLATHPMGGFVADRLRASFAIPAELQIVAVWAIGGPAMPDGLPDDLRARETAPRTRRPVAELLLHSA